MEFGVQFFPSVGPDRKSPARYWDEALKLTLLGEQLGYANARTVEHYFHSYGGYTLTMLRSTVLSPLRFR